MIPPKAEIRPPLCFPPPAVPLQHFTCFLPQSASNCISLVDVRGKNFPSGAFWDVTVQVGVPLPTMAGPPWPHVSVSRWAAAMPFALPATLPALLRPPRCGAASTPRRGTRGRRWGTRPGRSGTTRPPCRACRGATAGGRPRCTTAVAGCWGPPPRCPPCPGCCAPTAFVKNPSFPYAAVFF